MQAANDEAAHNLSCDWVDEVQVRGGMCKNVISLPGFSQALLNWTAVGIVFIKICSKCKNVVLISHLITQIWMFPKVQNTDNAKVF